MLTQRQENFVNNLFKGLTQRESWIQAGYSSKYALDIVDRHASDLAAKGEIKGRLEEMRKEVKSSLIATETERRERLSEYMRADLVDFIGKDGEPALSRDIPNHSAAREYYHRTKFDKGGNPIITKSIRLLNPISAIAELNKMDGIYETNPQNYIDNRTVNIYVRSEKTKELLERVSDRTKKLEVGDATE